MTSEAAEEPMPTPPTRTISQQQQNSMTMPNRRGPQSRPSLANMGPKPTPTRNIKPPSAPPPPPPSAHPPPPPHRTQPAPPPPSMQNYAKPSQIMSSSPLQSMSNPPTPPTRRHSLRNSGNSGETFESRFAHMFKSPQYLPPPEPFTQCAKTYPSRSQQFGGRQGSMMKRAPAPPPPAPPQKGAPPPPPAPPMWNSQPIR